MYIQIKYIVLAELYAYQGSTIHIIMAICLSILYIAIYVAHIYTKISGYVSVHMHTVQVIYLYRNSMVIIIMVLHHNYCRLP